MQHKTKWTITYTSGATRLVADEQTARTEALSNPNIIGMSTELLENILMLGDTMLTRFQARDRVEQTIIADRLRFMQERDALQALVYQMRSALRDYESMRDAMFAQCCSNPVFDSWGRQVDMTLLNDAHQAAERALRASEHVAAPQVNMVPQEPPPRRAPATPAPAYCPGGLPQCKWVDTQPYGSKCTTCGDTIPF